MDERTSHSTYHSCSGREMAVDGKAIYADETARQAQAEAVLPTTNSVKPVKMSAALVLDCRLHPSPTLKRRCHNVQTRFNSKINVTNVP